MTATQAQTSSINTVQASQRKTNRHLAALRCLATAAKLVEDPKLKAFMMDDHLNLSRLGTKTFLFFLAADFEGFRSKNPATEILLKDFALESKRRANDAGLTTTTVVVSTPKCPECGNPHTGYQVKLDTSKTPYPYVVCGINAKRVIVRLKTDDGASIDGKVTLATLKTVMFRPNFEIIGGSAEDIDLVTRISQAACR